MREFFANVLVVLGMFFGAGGEPKTTPPEISIEAPKEQPDHIVEVNKKVEDYQYIEAEQSQIGDTETTTDGKFEYPQPEAGWTPVLGNDTVSETAQKGQEGQITTIWGNGSQGQGELSMDHPRLVQKDKKGNIWFVDGAIENTKLRLFDGKKNKTIVDLVNNKLMDAEGYFADSGLAIIHNNVYISNEKDVYKVVNGRITQLDLGIRGWMKEHNYERIYRMEGHGNYLYLMVMSKSYYYSIVRWNLETKSMEEILPENTYPAPYNFYIYGDNDIFISTQNGYVVWEQIFPRQTLEGMNTGDREDKVLDVWIGEDQGMYYSVVEDQVYNRIYKNPKGESKDNSDVELVAGARRGFVDGIRDEIEMDYAMDFVWDGSGYIFADSGNNAIRKLWTTNAPGGGN